MPPIGLFDFHRAAELAELGREAARRELPALLDALRRAEPVTRRIARWAAGTLPDASEAEAEADAEASGEAVDAETTASRSPVAAEAADEEVDPRA